MDRKATSIPPDYFSDLYTRDPDPWRFATSEYERQKYGKTLISLPRARYDSALEIGSSIGVFTRLLAARCDRLLGIEPAAPALDQARRLNGDLSHVSFIQGAVPVDYPADKVFDLVVLSEVAYYLNRQDLEQLVRNVGMSLRSDAHVVLVHWTGGTDYPLTGHEAAELFIRFSSTFASVIKQERTEHYRLDILEQRPFTSLDEPREYDG